MKRPYKVIAKHVGGFRAIVATYSTEAKAKAAAAQYARNHIGLGCSYVVEHRP